MTREDMIREGLNLLSGLAHNNAVDHGFWSGDDERRTAAETLVEAGWSPDEATKLAFAQGPRLMQALMLVVSELAEAVEDYRDHPNDVAVIKYESTAIGNYMSPDGVPPKPYGFPIELADAVIRLGDLCGRYGIDLGKAVEVKMAYNKTRPMRHGGKAA